LKLRVCTWMQSKSAESTPNLRAGADFGLNVGLQKNQPNM